MARPPLKQGRRVGATVQKQASFAPRAAKVKTEETPKSTITTNAAGAPISIEQDAPDLVVPKMYAARTSTDPRTGTITSASDTQTLDPAGQVSQQTVEAPDMGATALQGEAGQVAAPEQTTAAQ